MRFEMIGELLDIVKFILGFLPWIVFLLLPTDDWDSLKRTIIICMAVSLLFAWKTLRKGFILQWATLVFFVFCTISLYGFSWAWLAKHMGIIANGFLSGVIWFTVLIGKPFTLQYARAGLPQEQWHNEGLVRGCRFIAIFWGTLLFVPTAFNALRLFYPSALPKSFYFYLSLFCIIIGMSYTIFYKHKKRKQRDHNSQNSGSP